MLKEGNPYMDRGHKSLQIDDKIINRIIIQGHRPAKINTLDIVHKVVTEQIPGDLAEAGVGDGGQIALMYHALNYLGEKRKIHMYDSFAGHPKPDSKDSEHIKGKYGVNDDIENPVPATRIENGSLENCMKNLKVWGAEEAQTIIHRGYFQNTLKDEHEKGTLPKLAYLRIDCNLGISTD